MTVIRWFYYYYLCTYDATLYYLANIGIFFGLTGRIIFTSSACSSGSQAIGYAMNRSNGLIPMMLAGGGEEFCPSEVYVFDSLYAASRNNDNQTLRHAHTIKHVTDW